MWHSNRILTCIAMLACLAMPLSRPARGAGVTDDSLPPHRIAVGSVQDVPVVFERGLRGHGPGAARIELSGLATLPGTAQPDGRGAAMAIKISGVPMVGSVAAFALAPGDATAVYIADQATADLFELYSSPADGSAAPVRISSGIVFGGGDQGVSAFRITADGENVVFLADAISGGGNDDLYSVPIDGSATPVRLNTGPDAPVTGFGVSPDGTRAAFFGADTVSGSGAIELHVASIGVAASAVQLSEVASANGGGAVVSAEFSPDGLSLIFAADGTSVDDVFQWYSVPLGAAGPGSSVQLSAALGSVGAMAISPDGNTVVYIGDDSSGGVFDVLAVPSGGGATLRLNPPMAGSGARAVTYSPQGSAVGYLADQDTAGVVEVYSALPSVGNSGSRLNTPMAGTQSADTVNISPDGSTVLYQADENTAATFELFGVPVDGSALPSTLHGLTAPDNVGFFIGLGTPVIGRRAVYPVLGAAVEVFSVPFDGSRPFTRVNHLLSTDESVLDAFLPLTATRLLAYGVGASSATVTEQAWIAATRSDLPPQQINSTAGAGSFGVLGYEISSSEDYGVYLQDQDTAGKPELYSVGLDSDGDGVANPADNCPFSSNTGQAGVVFAQTVFATGPTSFGWSEPAEVRFARGPLDGVATLVIDSAGSGADAVSFEDPASPLPDAGFYYVFAPDCAGRSYQTSLGAEPARDAALP